MRKKLAKFIYYKLMGWQIDGHYKILQNDLKKAVIIAAPHTSWHDFYIGVLVRTILGVEVNFIGKKELFVFPFGYFFKALGGRPINRRSSQNEVKAVAKLFKANEVFRIALAPEGTRKKVDKWRTGFYYIAKEAKVPIVMFTLDFGNKKNTFSKPFYTSDNVEKDLKYLRSFYKGIKGKIPEFS
ncbi:1-acyl-sn-glycerol-3-phosphate acyltransferase [Hyunsoonleella pacifica]|uniref:Acyltransferase n=1 Tax=Hyunsoonleella pacifica TaxID=1080224 RepID=A0A4Q9FJS1_9FLAO|nr:1-acyl-sn-glycerol-3-phosphate acyltransferase [Hyunsoonleella pacifica]TBN13181.1 acyltransferase [Hyunsoonleella pacifica]GGD28872.1 acyltransferase [Hyunsoonleella pacifica]